MTRFLLALVAFGVLSCGVIAGDLPTLTVEEKLQVREAQLQAAAVLEQRHQLQERWRQLEIELKTTRETLEKLVKSLKPADCEECTLKQDLTWHRPAPPAKK